MDTGENKLSPLSEFSVTETKPELKLESVEFEHRLPGGQKGERIVLNFEYEKPPGAEKVKLPSGQEVTFISPEDAKAAQSTLEARMQVRRSILDTGFDFSIRGPAREMAEETKFEGTLGQLLNAESESRAAAKRRLFITGDRSRMTYDAQQLLGETTTRMSASVIKSDKDSYIFGFDPAAAKPEMMSGVLCNVGEDGTVKSVVNFDRPQPDRSRGEEVVRPFVIANSQTMTTARASMLYNGLPLSMRGEIDAMLQAGTYPGLTEAMAAAVSDPYFFRRYKLLQNFLGDEARPANNGVEIKGVHLKDSRSIRGRKYQNSGISGAHVPEGASVADMAHASLTMACRQASALGGQVLPGQLKDQSLEGVNPFDRDLTNEVKMAIMRECAVNPWYFYNIITTSFDMKHGPDRDYFNMWVANDAPEKGRMFSEDVLKATTQTNQRPTIRDLKETFNRNNLIEAYCGLHIPTGTGGLEAACRLRQTKFIVYASGEVIEMAQGLDGTTKRLTQTESREITVKLKQSLQDYFKRLYGEASKHLPVEIDHMAFYRRLYLNDPHFNRKVDTTEAMRAGLIRDGLLADRTPPAGSKLTDLFGGKGVIVSINAETPADVQDNHADIIMDLDPIFPSKQRLAELGWLPNEQEQIAAAVDLHTDKGYEVSTPEAQAEFEAKRNASLQKVEATFGPFSGISNDDVPLGEAVFKEAQARHDALPRGTYQVEDTTIFAAPVRRGYTDGIKQLHDSMIGSRDVAKDLIKDPLPFSDVSAAGKPEGLLVAQPTGYTPDVVDPAIDIMAATRNFLK